MKLIVGLGNPGRKYAKTRHNFGFMLVDVLARRWNLTIDKRRHHGRFGGGIVDGKRVDLLKPTTFMNGSGQSVWAAVDYYQLSPQDVLIVLDDLSLSLGQLRIRTRGSGGGHKGLIDILDRFGTNDVPRLRLGIGAPPPMVDAVDYVLADFASDERPVVDNVLNRAADAIELARREGYDLAMERYNRPADSPAE